MPAWAYDALVIGVALVHLLLVIDPENQPAAGFAVLGVAALAVRRRYPFLVLCATLPAAVLVTEKVATLFALYALAYRSGRALVSVSAVVVTMFAFARVTMTDNAPWLFHPADPELFLGMTTTQVMVLRQNLYFLLMASVPVILAHLQRARHDLAARFVEITEAREHEQRLLTQQALAAERAQLAREMHDVVSHQVSLIAVQAGALELQAPDGRTRSTAEAIREVSVTTLEELRQMVRVLHASGRRGEGPVPQPSIAQLRRLVEGSGIDAELEIGPLPELDPPAQRAVYRTVQEALTNARKHAPGAKAAVRLSARGGAVVVEVANTAATRPVVELPSSRVGLLGLRQRAELLDGAIEYGPDGAGGWLLRLTLPAEAASPTASGGR
ncbi:sensor histidine kinase [Glycomyces terrestris]|uniref:histidine kinase n=1 Tax=Glycomyces terrestris TaxID=2493553 RepID=A0A426V4Q8_9ACTN|nr:histidine kinase [Glycomyces terrestris]RRS01884.1 two-component sensor histidine kinase [Glycomyces terrestris]